MKNEKQTSNSNFNVQLFWKSENHLFCYFLSQLLYRNENQNFISNFIFQFIKKKNEMALWVHGLYTNIKIASKKGIWKWQKSFALRLEKVSWVALFHTTNKCFKRLLMNPRWTTIMLSFSCFIYRAYSSSTAIHPPIFHSWRTIFFMQNF